MNLKTFSETVIRPTVLRSIKNGFCDDVITDEEITEFYKDDPEMMQAISDRLKVINENT